VYKLRVKIEHVKTYSEHDHENSEGKVLKRARGEQVADEQYDAQRSWPKCWFENSCISLMGFSGHKRGDQSSPCPFRSKEAIIENWVSAPIRLQRRASLPAAINSPSSVTTDIKNGYDTVTENKVRITRVHCDFVSVNEKS
jgi:hypothetical protein